MSAWEGLVRASIPDVFAGRVVGGRKRLGGPHGWGGMVHAGPSLAWVMLMITGWPGA